MTTLPATQGLSTESCFTSHRDYTHCYRLSHSELVDIEKVAVCSSLRSLKQKCTIKSRAKRERFYTSARNPVKEILLKLNLPDHRIHKDGGEANLLQLKIDDPNTTMEEYIRLEEEKARRHGKLTSEEELSCEPTVSPLNDNKIDFRISFDESYDQDYTPTVSYFDDLDYLKYFENEFPTIVYNDALTSKSDFLTEPIVSSQHVDEFDLKDETSLSECDGDEQNVLYFNDLFPFNVIYLDDLKSDKDNDDDKIDIEYSFGDLSIEPLPNVINTDDDAYAHGSNKLLEISHDTSNKFFQN
ncbi:hypothetical protein Tco_0923922 [Tanacetum coccineum]|uniref:Uncharacterized protein n=1 Tax=Tanacetum coccineum TaxID=301880 RepID=A0ABQ5D3F9_9ASTR